MLLCRGVDEQNHLSRSSLKKGLGDDYSTLELVRKAQAKGALLSELELNFPAAAWRASQGACIIRDGQILNASYPLSDLRGLSIRKQHYALDVRNLVRVCVGLKCGDLCGEVASLAWLITLMYYDAEENPAEHEKSFFETLSNVQLGYLRIE